MLALAAALALSACGDSSQDRLTGRPGEEGTATINDAELNGVIEADRDAAAVAEAPTMPVPPREIPLADVVEPLGPEPVAVPSFDCANAWRDAERMICGDPQLAALDRAMAASYFRALKAADAARAALLQQSGGEFIRYRNRCSDEGCIAGAYQDRIDEIADIMGGR
ncbi:MAG: hypothetical protein ACR2FK_02260 [Sphingomicrobium sp.]